jgi:hypothetical protein
MPRGYGGVAVIWRKEIDHIIRPIEDGSEKIQCIEIHGNKNSEHSFPFALVNVFDVLLNFNWPSLMNSRI